jgi:hypothetical protein
MSPRARKLVLTAHVTTSVGWLGALAVFLAHALVGLMSQEEQVVRATSIAMELTAWVVIMPLCIATLVTGLTQALGSAWGVARHYWVFFKLVITVIATAVLLLKLGPISVLADAASTAAFSSGDLLGLRRSLALHAAGGVLILLGAAALGVYKPAGLIGNALPKWVKVFGGLIFILMMLVAMMLLAGGHGPGAHT